MTIDLPRWILLVLGGLFIAGFAIGATLLLSDGGGDSTTTVIQEPAAGATGEQGVDESFETPSPSQGESTEEQDCDALGINRQQRQEGTCIEDGQKVVVVNRDSPLKLKTLTAQLKGYETSETLEKGYGQPATANGVFVFFTLKITNESRRPQHFSLIGDQTLLFLGDSTFSEFSKFSPPGSFADKYSEMQPGQTQTGTVVYEIPDKFLSSVEKNGNLDIVNFGDYVDQGRPKEIGVIRMYEP